MSNDWEPGDIALCVRGGPVEPINPNYKGPYPELGKPYTVEALENYEFYGVNNKIPGLRLKDGPPNGNNDRTWRESRFIKVTPKEADDFDKETIDLYNKTPVKETA